MTRKKELSLSIGQVVYILSNAQTIVPAKVVEEATVQTLKGKCVSWKLAIGKKDEQKIIDHKEVDGEIFLTLKEIKTELTKRLNGFIKGLVEKAKQRELAWFSEEKQATSPANVSKKQTKENASIKPIPDEQKADLREELKKISTPTEEEMAEKPEEKEEAVENTEASAMVTMPDGTKVPIILPDETGLPNNLKNNNG